jgi:cytochrome c
MNLPFRRINLGLVAAIQLVAAVLLAHLFAPAGDEPVALAAASAHDDEVLRSCVACHQIGGRVHKVGPHLVGIVGRPAGSAPGFAYTDAMREAGFVWTPERLRAYLRDPQAVVPGTSMAIGSLEPAAIDAIVAQLADAD